MKVLWQCYSHISPLQQLEFSEKGEDMGEKFSIERKTNKVLSFNESLCILTDPALGKHPGLSSLSRGKRSFLPALHQKVDVILHSKVFPTIGTFSQ